MPRKMKESGVEWLGQIPDGWGVRRNKYCYACGKEIVGSKSSDTTLLSLTTRGVKEKPAGAVGGKQPETFDTYQVVRPNDIVLCLFDLDCSAVFSGISHYDGMISPAYKVVSCKRFVCSQYAEYWFRFVSEGRKFKAYAKNLRYTLSYEEFETLPMLCPPLPEQQRIAAFLDERCAKIDGMIAEAKTSIEDYKKWKRSIIFEAVTGKREKNLKSSGVDWIGDVPEGWKVCAMKTAIDILPGYAFESEAFASSEGIRLLRGVNVSVDSLRWDETVYWNASVDDKLAEYLIKENDLIVGLDRPWISGGTRAVLAKESDLPCLLVQRVCRIRAKEGNDIRFLLYLLKQEGFEKELSVETTGVSVPHISTKQIENFKVPLPSVNVQRRIAAFLDEKCAAIDKLVGEKESLIADLESYKKSLIFETVTGKREVA